MSFLKYSCEYEKSVNFNFFDLSIIIHDGNEPISICPIFLLKESKKSKFLLQIKNPIFTNEYKERKNFKKIVWKI